MLACKGGQAKMKMKLLPSQASCSWNEDTIGFFYCKTLLSACQQHDQGLPVASGNATETLDINFSLVVWLEFLADPHIYIWS
jgi:hypothetical protein